SSHRCFLLEQTILHRNDFMAAGGISANADPSGCVFSNGILCLIPAPIGKFTANGFKHTRILKATNSLQRIKNTLTFERHRLCIGHMTALTTAAMSVSRTIRRSPCRGALQNLHETSLAIARRLANHFYANEFSAQGVGDEDNPAIHQTPNALQLRTISNNAYV